jgi:crotonobetainyl-CoA:carnitine CoA-transferase CaiB-like acyl-CoA transferase
MTTYRPLTGIRILSFEIAASLPAGTRTLADLGADVVRVAEPPTQANPYIRVFDSSLINKQSIVIDLRRPEGHALALRLATAADVVCSNFRPHVLPRFGLDYASLRAIKPAIIVMQLSGFGTPGPWQDFPAYGPHVEAAGGMNALMGEPHELPQRVGGGVFADTLAGRYAALAICAAIVRRDATGEGQHLDLSMYESIVTGIGDLVMRASAEGRPPPRLGNRAEQFAPQGVYPCMDDGGSAKDSAAEDCTPKCDEWVAISVTSDEEWCALRRVLRDPALDDPAFDSMDGRRRAHGLIDGAIARWTRRRDKLTAAETLQRAGVPAGPVQHTGDLPVDPHYRARGFFQLVRHRAPILGYSAHPHMRMPAHVVGYGRAPLSDHRAEGTGAGEILRRWLGADADEIACLENRGAFGAPRPLIPPGTSPPPWFGARDAERHADFATRLGIEHTGEGGT